MFKRIKVGMVAGVTAFALWGGAALAQDDMGSMDPVQPESTEQAWPETEPSTDININTDDRDIAEVEPTYVDPVVVVEDDAKLEDEDKSTADMRGLTLMLGGGVEGYTGALAPRINPGAAWGVTAALKPTKVLGLELSYNGAANDLDSRELDGNAATGADIVRNGGQAVATVGLTATGFQPYLLGGFGVSDYRVRGDATAAGFSDDFNTHVPVGAGLRTHIGNFTADARFNYSVMLDQDFAEGTRATNVGGVDAGIRDGRYTGSLNLGTTF